MAVAVPSIEVAPDVIAVLLGRLGAAVAGHTTKGRL
jgi:hypothetical protein